METLASEGLELSAEQEAQLRKAEEEIIQKEILPVLTEKIEPVLSQIERELVLVVDYVPGSPMKVSLSRKRNISDVLADAVEIKPDPEVAHRTYGPQKTKKEDIAPKTLLQVTMPDGKVIRHDKAKDTFIEAIRRVGIDRVRPLGLTFCRVPIISNKRDSKYGKAQHMVEGGWLILTHSSTKDKKKMLDEIAQSLNINMKTEIVESKYHDEYESDSIIDSIHETSLNIEAEILRDAESDRLYVLHNNQIIREQKSYLTFIKTLNRIGLDRVKALSLSVYGTRLISNHIDSDNAQLQIRLDNGMYVLAMMRLQDYRDIIAKISESLDSNIKVLIK